MLRLHLSLLVLVPLLSTALGCAGLGLGSCPEIDESTFVAVPASGIEPTCAEAKQSAAELLELATNELRSSKLELGYRHLALIHILYPESEQDPEAFTLAARVFRKNHFRNRTQAGSVWVTTEPQFMFGWLASFFPAPSSKETGDFPQHQVNAMFLGMHYGMFRDFVAYAAAHAPDRPELSRWAIRAEDDNGIVYSVTAVPSDPEAAPAG